MGWGCRGLGPRPPQHSQQLDPSLERGSKDLGLNTKGWPGAHPAKLGSTTEERTM